MSGQTRFPLTSKDNLFKCAKYLSFEKLDGFPPGHISSAVYHYLSLTCKGIGGAHSLFPLLTAENFECFGTTNRIEWGSTVVADDVYFINGVAHLLVRSDNKEEMDQLLELIRQSVKG